MRKFVLLTALCALSPALAFAHDTGAPHLHPHGIGVVLAGMAIAFAGFYLYREEAKRPVDYKDSVQRRK